MRDDEDSVLNLEFSLVLNQSCEVSCKDSFACPFAFRGARTVEIRHIRKAESTRQTHGDSGAVSSRTLGGRNEQQAVFCVAGGVRR